MSELLTIIVDARTAQEAQEQARLWARAEPRVRLRTITRVRPTEGVDEWAVELAIETDGGRPVENSGPIVDGWGRFGRVPGYQRASTRESQCYEVAVAPPILRVSSQPNTGSAPMTLPARTIYPRDPACMTAAERDAWAEANRQLKGNRATSPCHDCSGAFAAGMRAEGRCDGHYPDEADERPGLVRRPNGYWGFASEEQRIAARRASWRESGARRRVVTA